MWESPIQILQTQMQMELEGETLKAVQKVGVNVDKEELLRALSYDRGQYDKGYQDGVNDVCNRIIGRLEEHEEKHFHHDFEADRFEFGAYVATYTAIEIVKGEMENGSR